MRHLIVDGYNVLRTSRRYKEAARRDLDSARARLVADAAAIVDAETRVTVVFDAGGNRASTGAIEMVAGVEVVFSPSGRTADDVIESLAASAKSSGEDVVVVTSDAATQHAVMGGGVVRMSAREFGEQVDRDEGERAESLKGGSAAVPIEKRIDAEVRRVLERWIGRER
ncbi:MAG: NYN domain-containing protein [Anaerosomatales bacterium]|nr:NYN domain-containing protein [Anaerosomatales bacterium]GAV32336.1 predicted RNA-binding protein containing a PIN domain [Coriobacteriaceae bacterium EMTCatB1]